MQLHPAWDVKAIVEIADALQEVEGPNPPWQELGGLGVGQGRLGQVFG